MAAAAARPNRFKASISAGKATYTALLVKSALN
jgi:hypothetical protein